ncbi:MAG: hypothetical protein QOC56_1420 [Alphaproteobacteria bacterium]|nr:hypothetical protein [Alphaproteobacteria bacterium]
MAEKTDPEPIPGQPNSRIRPDELADSFLVPAQYANRALKRHDISLNRFGIPKSVCF